MCCSINNDNNLHLKIYGKVERPKQKLTQVNTIKYDLNLFKGMITIVSCTDIQIKILKILTTHRRYVDIVNEYVTQI